jgi:exosome complex component RRP45
MREKAVSLAEKKFILQALARKQRLDHRGLLDQRQILIQLSNRITGTCLVSLGETKVLCQTNYKVEEPRETRPSEGKLRINLESSTSPVYDNEKVDASGQEYSAIQSLLEQAFVKSSALDHESLCIRVGASIFVIECSLSVIEDDGALVDCCSLAIAAALRSFKLPCTQVTGDQVVLDKSKTRNLSVHHTPFLITFANFHENAAEQVGGVRKVKNTSKIQDKLGEILLDPTRMETKLSQGSVILAMNKHRELCAMTTTGGVCLNMDDLSRAITVAEKLVKIMHESVENALKYNGVDQFQMNVDMSIKTENKIDENGVKNAEMGENDSDDDNNVDLETIEYAGALAPVINEQDWGISELISGIREKTGENVLELQQAGGDEGIPWSELTSMKE